MKFEWELMAHKEPDAGTRFVALYSDGSGSELLERKEDGSFYHCDGDSMEFVLNTKLDDFLYWAYLPEGYKFWGEE